MLGLEEYSRGFKEGYTYVLYDSEPDTRKKQRELVKSDIESIGYHDGYEYAEYLELTSQTMSISHEQLVAEIDKRHTNALKNYADFLNPKAQEKGSTK